MLARLQDCLGHDEMGVWDGQVDDNIHRRIGQKIFDRLGLCAEFIGPWLRRGQAHIRNRAHV
jgi:hypothetical protein